ncbi:MAG: hypothetical protein ACKVQK_25350 [Burkholderiales bacterium]
MRLEANTSQSFLSFGSIVVSCLSGELWVTHEGEIRDFIFPRGYRYCSRQGGLVVASSVHGASIALICLTDHALPREFSKGGVVPDTGIIAHIETRARHIRHRETAFLVRKWVRAMRRAWRWVFPPFAG